MCYLLDKSSLLFYKSRFIHGYICSSVILQIKSIIILIQNQLDVVRLDSIRFHAQPERGNTLPEKVRLLTYMSGVRR